MAENIYFECRKRAATDNPTFRSRARTAEMLGISEASLANYERGQTKQVPTDMVVKMAEAYNTPELKYHYCKHHCPIGCYIPLATAEETIEKTAVRLLATMDPETIGAATKRIVKIAADGEVSKEEAKELEPIMDALSNMVLAVSQLGIIAERMTKWTSLKRD